MKRSKHINLDFMRKVPSKTPYKVLSKGFAFNSLALGIAVALTGCSQTEQVKIVKSVEDCIASTELTPQECEITYQRALAEAERTGPKYNNANACETEFGYGQCQRSSGGFFMPFMAGYMVSSLMSNRQQAFNPVYRYQGANSRNRNKIMTADGSVLGQNSNGSYTTNKSSVSKRKPTISRTVSRGGFGSTASAKSNWGGGKSRSWGG
jgi:uncharacterized protein YgiB involved in biofilm formation